MDIKEVLLQWFINILMKRLLGGATMLARSQALTTPNKSAVKNENMSNKELVEELHKPIIRKF